MELPNRRHIGGPSNPQRDAGFRHGAEAVAARLNDDAGTDLEEDVKTTSGNLGRKAFAADNLNSRCARLPEGLARKIGCNFSVLRRGGAASKLVQPFTSPNRRFATSATCRDCSLSHAILDGGNGWLTGQVAGFNVCETIDPMSELNLPELVERFAMFLP